MPLFGKKEAQETPSRKLSDVVLEMITRSVPEDKIITTLVSTGLSESEARRVYEQVKKEYEGYLASKLKLEVHRLFEEEKKNFESFLREELRKTEKEILLKTDLKSMERHEVLEKKIEDMKAMVESVKSDLFNFKIQFNSAVQDVQKQLNQMKVKGTTKIMVSIVLMLSGSLIALYSFLGLHAMLSKFALSTDLVPMSVYAVMIILGAVFAKFGVDVYLSTQTKEYKEYGLDWMKKEGAR